MRAPQVLVALYPPGIRQRWGDELAAEIAAAGPRGWPDTVCGAVRLWLRPSSWPETATGQTRQVLAVALFGTVTVVALWLRAVDRAGSLTADPVRPSTSAWLLPVLLGTALAVPLPPPSLTALRHLLAVATRTLTLPAVLLAILLFGANSGRVDHPAPIIHLMLLALYWGTLILTGLRLCTLVARVTSLAPTPSTNRLRASLLLVGAGLTLATSQTLATTLLPPFELARLALAVSLAVPAIAALTAGLDLHPTHR